MKITSRCEHNALSAIWPNLITSVSIFIFGSLSLIAPTGYSWGPALLVLASALFLILPSHRPKWPGREYIPVAAILILFFGAAVIEFLWHGLDLRTLDRPSRFIFALCVIPLLAQYPPRLDHLWAGFAIGALGAGIWACQQVFVEGMARARGDTQTIQFGNIAMLMGAISLAGFLWLRQQKRSEKIFKTLMLAGFAGGVTASMLSGSRGGWLALPVCIAITLYACYARKFQLTKVRSTGLAVLSVGFIAVLSFASDTLIQKRLNLAFQEAEEYFTEAEATTSIGVRFEMWKAAAELGYERPILGWGSVEIEKAKAKLAQAGRVNSAVLQFTHAHNDFLDNWQKRGLLGLGALLALYFVPLFFFIKRLKAGGANSWPVALAGVMMCISYIIFSLSQGFLEHNSGVMVYAFLLVTLWVLSVESEKADNQDYVAPAK